ncbi:MAG TPA: citrate synthase [Burkholderiaceae bacterium]|nr:citrate synthase [Burkholderiaceae bacterium]
MNDDRLWITAKQAAGALGVSLPTLYAYVSRKLIRSRSVQGSRRRRYWKADIDRLGDEQDASAQSNVALGLINETKITLLTERGLYYRGKNVVGLAETESFETVAALLWEADAQAIFTEQVPAVPASYAKLKRGLGDLTVAEQAMALLPMIERANPRLYDLSKSGIARAGADLTRWYAAIMVGANGPSSAPLHEFIAASLRAPPGLADVVRRLLILAADHEFDPTTFAVRAVANAGVTPCYAVLTGLIVTGGQRLQAGRAGAASRLLEEIVASSDPRDSIVARFRNGEPLPGFSPSKNSNWDPRAEAMMRALETSLGDDAEFKRLQRATDTAMDIAGLQPDFILPATFVGRRLGLKGQELIVASVGRIAGWIAHAMEQYHAHELIRPHANYTGPLPA